MASYSFNIIASYPGGAGVQNLDDVQQSTGVIQDGDGAGIGDFTNGEAIAGPFLGIDAVFVGTADINGESFAVVYDPGSNLTLMYGQSSDPAAAIDYFNNNLNPTDISANAPGGIVSSGTFTTCFSAGTLIATPEGEVAVETLAVGDLVLTLDHGAQPIRWIGGAEIDLIKTPNMRPIRIRAGALGEALPFTDLLVSPQHRVLVRSKIAQRMFDTDEVLVAAKQLLALDVIELVENMVRIAYYHFLFDRHQVVFSNGAQTESLFTGPEALKSVGRAARDEIFALFPELANVELHPARVVVPGRKARRLASRHAKHKHPLAQ